MKKVKLIDKRIKIKRNSWLGYVLMFIALIILSALPAVFFSDFDIELLYNESGKYALPYLAYWAVVALIVLTIIAIQKRKLIDEPLQKIGLAAKEVAEGDFSVYLAPRHSKNRYDNMDVIFEDFNKMVQDLGSLETMKSDFIASVSHEIKTPLANIEGYTSALKSSKLTKAERNEYIDTIIESSDKLARLVTNILKLNRFENQTVELNIKTYDLCRQLSDCVISFEDHIAAKKLQLDVKMDDIATIETDKTMLEIVWNNLLSNAIKFSKTGGRLSIKQESTDRTVTVSICDEGVGMNGKQLEHIFDKFYQADSSRSNDGNGLGLSLVCKIIEILNGEIIVKSEPQKGSSFTVNLMISRSS